MCFFCRICLHRAFDIVLAAFYPSFLRHRSTRRVCDFDPHIAVTYFASPLGSKPRILVPKSHLETTACVATIPFFRIADSINYRLLFVDCRLRTRRLLTDQLCSHCAVNLQRTTFSSSDDRRKTYISHLPHVLVPSFFEPESKGCTSVWNQTGGSKEKFIKKSLL